MHAFFYGCSYKEDPVQARIFPYAMSKINKNIQYKDCQFSITKDKDTTARVTLWKELRL